MARNGSWEAVTASSITAWNTFSKEEADHMTRATGGTIKIEKVIKMPLLEINDVMAKHFGEE